MLPKWALGATTNIAVATNFRGPAVQLAEVFEQTSGHQAIIISASTGKLYAQIRHGAPFDILLAADQQRPARLEDAGLIEANTRRTYAIGHLALYGIQNSSNPKSSKETLSKGSFKHLAIANPQLAPYGLAAQQTLAALEVNKHIQPKLVFADNVAQAFAMVDSGNAEYGLIARSLLTNAQQQQAWLVPGTLHEPIRQDVVLLARAKDNVAATAFIDFLRSKQARALIESAGFTAPSND